MFSCKERVSRKLKDENVWRALTDKEMNPTMLRT